MIIKKNIFGASYSCQTLAKIVLDKSKLSIYVFIGRLLNNKNFPFICK